MLKRLVIFETHPHFRRNGCIDCILFQGTLPEWFLAKSDVRLIWFFHVFSSVFNSFVIDFNGLQWVLICFSISSTFQLLGWWTALLDNGIFWCFVWLEITKEVTRGFRSYHSYQHQQQFFRGWLRMCHGKAWEYQQRPGTGPGWRMASCVPAAWRPRSQVLTSPKGDQLTSCTDVQCQSGWWFQTCFIFHNIWDNPSHWLILFKMVKTTNQQCFAKKLLNFSRYMMKHDTACFFWMFSTEQWNRTEVDSTRDSLELRKAQGEQVDDVLEATGWIILWAANLSKLLYIY